MISWRIYLKLFFLLLLLNVIQSNFNNLNLCRNNSHVDGEWKYLSHLADKSWVCHYNPNFNTSTYIYHDGQENYEYSRGCVCDEKQNTTTSISEREKYEWYPSSCHLPKWNASHFCDLLGSRTILMTGDSTMHQTATALMSMITYHGGNCANRIVYAQSHYLIFGGINFKVIDHIVEHKNQLPDIVIMTVGAHLQDMGDLRMVWDGFLNDLSYLRSSNTPWGYHNFTFVWKTQNPGHLNCTNIFEPFTRNNVRTRDPNDPSDIFHWNLHSEFDKYNVEMASKNGFKVIDMSPLYYRPDAHVALNLVFPNKKVAYDCLHYCNPGPLNLFVILLYNMFLNNEL